MKFVQRITFFFAIITIIATLFMWWMNKTFGQPHMYQIMWHITNAKSFEGVDDNYIRHALQVILGIISLIYLMYFIIFKKQKVIEKFFNRIYSHIYIYI